jgi:hypothetical protein
MKKTHPLPLPGRGAFGNQFLQGGEPKTTRSREGIFKGYTSSDRKTAGPQDCRTAGLQDLKAFTPSRFNTFCKIFRFFSPLFNYFKLI